MAEQNNSPDMTGLGQENTLQKVLDQLKVANELDTGHSVASERIFGEIKKTRSDAGKHHDWNKKESKSED